MFNVDDDFELSGADFIQLCEELLHEMKMEEMKELHELEFGMTKTFWHLTPQALFKFLHSLRIDHLPEEGCNYQIQIQRTEISYNTGGTVVQTTSKSTLEAAAAE